MPEYGRVVQDMVDVAMTLPNKEERTRCAEKIVALMARIASNQSNQPDFATKLWNHLARISHYNLDIDYPTPIISEEQASTRPTPLPYPMKRIMRKHYGYLVEECLRNVTELPEGPERDALVRLTANQMRQDLYDWNYDVMDEELVAQDIAHYTKGAVHLDLKEFHFAPIVEAGRPQSGKGKKKKK